MRIDGHWLLCTDGTLRPVVTGEIRGTDGSWHEVTFLIDTGADATALSSDVFHLLGLDPLPPEDGGGRIEGVGGAAISVVVVTAVRIPTVDGTVASFPGRFIAFTEPGPLELSYLGRNILNNFAVIVDRPGDAVCILFRPHRYVILEA